MVEFQATNGRIIDEEKLEEVSGGVDLTSINNLFKNGEGDYDSKHAKNKKNYL